MNYWVLKTDSDVYPFEQLERDRTTTWDGVSNAVAQDRPFARDRGPISSPFDPRFRSVVIILLLIVILSEFSFWRGPWHSSRALIRYPDRLRSLIALRREFVIVHPMRAGHARYHPPLLEVGGPNRGLRDRTQNAGRLGNDRRSDGVDR